MLETLRMMKGILNGKECKVEEKVIIKEYQNNLMPNILAYFYCDNFGMIYNLCKSYPLLTNEDKASFCLQELDKCLQNYDLESNTKFITYFINCYKNRLRTETEAMMLNTKRINNQLLDISLYSGIKEFDIHNIDVILDDYKLDNIEKYYCKLIDMGYTVKEIAGVLKLKPTTIYKKIGKIKKKILNSSIKFA